VENSGFFALGTLALVLLFFGARSIDDDGRFNPLREPAPMLVETASGGESSITISAQKNGHFILDARIGGRRTELMIDSGATVVTLRESDARKAGLTYTDRDFKVPFSTANGEVFGAVDVLPELTVGDITLHDLRISVLPDDKLDMSLFGTNGLNRFPNRKTTPDKLVLYTN